MIGRPFLDAAPVLEAIEHSGFEAYFVGGSVRDHILGRVISDVDIATSALPEELKQIFPKTTDIGIEHGTILVHFKGAAYEVTTYRAESGYSDFRRPDKVSFIRSLEDDLQRRDFTMNAMAMDRQGRIIDPFRGQQAIANRQIVTVGNPDERFREDALRMLRAIRFHSQLGFEIEENTLASLERNSALLVNIAVERRAIEFEKILVGQNRQRAIEMLARTGIHQYLPGLGGQKDRLVRFSEIESKQLTLAEMWALLLFTLEIGSNEYEPFLRSWKLPVQRIRKIKDIVTWLHYREHEEWTRKTVYGAGLETAISAEKIINSISSGMKSDIPRIKDLYEGLPIKNRSDLQVSGNDLMEWLDRGAGPWIRDVLEEVERAVIFREVQNKKDQIREWLQHAIRN